MSQQTTQLLAAIRAVQEQHEQFKAGFWQFALVNLTNDIPATIIEKFKTLTLTHSEMKILSELTTFSSNVVPYKKLQERMLFSQGMFSRYINRLSKAELITKTNQLNNKKEVVLSITEVGKYVAKLHTHMHRLEEQHNEKALLPFSKAEVQTAIEVLNSLNANK